MKGGARLTRRGERVVGVARYATACTAVVLLVALCAWAGGLERVAW